MQRLPLAHHVLPGVVLNLGAAVQFSSIRPRAVAMGPEPHAAVWPTALFGGMPACLMLFWLRGPRPARLEPSLLGDPSDDEHG
jgi:hypothetical protein